jgi:parafibromin
MSDPLALLRQSIADSRPAELLTASGEPTTTLTDAASLRFPQAGGEPVVVPKDASTRYARSDARTEFYTVGQLWVVWEKRDASLKDFMQSFTALGVGNVPIADRRAVQAFLAGESDGGARVGEGECGGGGGTLLSFHDGDKRSLEEVRFQRQWEASEPAS